MQNTYSWYKSRTVWTVVLMFLIGGFTNISGFLPAGSETWVIGALGLLATYFHIDTAKTGGVTN